MIWTARDRHAFGVGIACLADPLRGGYPLIAACTRQATDTNDLRRIGRAITAGQFSGLGLTIVMGAVALLLVQHHEVLGCAVGLVPVVTIHGLSHALGRHVRVRQRPGGAPDG